MFTCFEMSCLYMSHRESVGNVLSIPLCVLTCEEIDNKATLTLNYPSYVQDNMLVWVTRVVDMLASRQTFVGTRDMPLKIGTDLSS